MLDTYTVLAFMEFLSLSDFPGWFRFALQFIVLGASLLLLIFMMRYEGRSLLDTALLLRELAFTLLIVRLTTYNVFGITNTSVTDASYLFLAIACVLVVYSVMRARTIMFFDHRKSFLSDDEEGINNGNEKL